MLRGLIEYIRSLFCDHTYELIFDTYVHESIDTHKSISYHKKTYRCTKCGYCKKYTSK